VTHTALPKESSNERDRFGSRRQRGYRRRIDHEETWMSRVEHAVALLVIQRMKNELLACAETVWKIQQQQIVPQWKRDLNCAYYRDRIRKLEVAIARAEVEEELDARRPGSAVAPGNIVVGR
jgi:hypothetical protein